MDDNIEVKHEGKLNSSAITLLLSAKYAAPAWAFYAEVPDGTGSSFRRRLDAVAVSLWSKPGVGHTIAFEVKISRSDFKNEIADPTKRKSAIENSNEFYFVCEKGIVKPEEVPEDCGLIEVVGCPEKGTISLRTVKIAQQRQTTAFSRQFFASLSRQQDTRGADINKFPAIKYAGASFSVEDFDKLVANQVSKRVLDETEVIQRHEALKAEAASREKYGTLIDKVYRAVTNNYANWHGIEYKVQEIENWLAKFKEAKAEGNGKEILISVLNAIQPYVEDSRIDEVRVKLQQSQRK